MPHSEMNLNDWHGSLSLFSGFYDTRTALELDDVSWPVVVANIAPTDGPALLVDKKRATYFVGSALKVAPLVNGTREKAAKLGLPLLGKQRSAAHITETRMVVIDMDRISEEQLAVIEKRLQAAGLTYLLYSTHSYGRADKPGIRCRVVIPFDSPLNVNDYKLVAAGANILLFDGLGDPSGFALHQQQGVWVAAPVRAHMAFRRAHKAGVASAAALIAAAPKVARPQRKVDSFAYSGPVLFDVQRVNAALEWLDPNSYKSWVDAAIWLKATYGVAAYQVWLAWSETANEASKAKNGNEYDPGKVWAEIEPRITSDQGAGALFAQARNVSLEAAQDASSMGQWDERGRMALVYLRRYHPRLYSETFGVAA
jgi:hypothetical protein